MALVFLASVPVPELPVCSRPGVGYTGEVLTPLHHSKCLWLEEAQEHLPGSGSQSQEQVMLSPGSEEPWEGSRVDSS